MNGSNNTSQPGLGAASPSPLDRVTALLGDDIFFIPCKWGTKKPLTPYVERSFESTKTPAYRALFDDGQANIAVYLGRASGGLCAIDFDADKDLAAFLAANTKLAETTRSRGSRGGMLWMRITGDCPESCSPSHKHFEWRADKRLSTIYGRHPKGMDYTLVVDAVPVVLSFAEIIWPDGWELPWERANDAKLRQLYGEPFYRDEDGAVTSINEAYWAGLYAAENTMLYEPDERTFYHYHAETGLYEVESVDLIRTKIATRMLEASRQSNVFDLQKKRTANTLNNVISHLRGLVECRGAFTERQKIVHLANGVIVFNGSEAELREFSPEFKSRNRSPISFDENARCDRFLNELVLPAVHAEDVELLQKFAGSRGGMTTSGAGRERQAVRAEARA